MYISKQILAIVNLDIFLCNENFSLTILYKIYLQKRESI